MLHLGPLYLAGPTAVGKSEIAAALAERFDGEIIGADAFQVYRGLNLLTAKPDPATLARVPHHLIGEIPLTDSFDVARYHQLACERMNEITQRGKSPIIVGGTGLYIRALTHGLADLPPPDEELRAELSAQPLDRLLGRLGELDPITAQRIDRQNARRVVRALEVCIKSGKPFSSFREQWANAVRVPAVLLTRNRKSLYQRIDQRTVAMFSEGVVREVEAVTEIGPTASQAIGFREIHDLIAGDLNEPACIVRIQQQTRNYAKRQLTWFRKEPHFQTIELDEEESQAPALDRIVAAFDSFR
jgi:tRNA dimethylallyltransferase